MAELLHTISMAEFMATSKELAVDHPEDAAYWEEIISWANKYNPFTPVELWGEKEGGPLVPRVAPRDYSVSE